MNSCRCFALALLLIAAGAAGGAEESPWAGWSHRADVLIEGTPSGGLVELALTPEVFDLVRADLGDLRFAAADGREAPFVLIRPRGGSQKTTLTARLYNRTWQPGESCSITADFGRKAMKDHVAIATPGHDFRRACRLEGSDDGTTWSVLRDGAFLFHVSADAGAVAYVKDTVGLPDNDFRYLRVTVLNGADDPQRLEITGLKTWRTVRTSAPAEPVPVAAAGARQVKDTTEIEIDLGCRNLPLRRLRLEFADADFFRRVTVEGRSRKTRILRVPFEDEPARTREVEEPWRRIRDGVVYRYTAGKGRDESLDLDLSPARFRYLRVRVANRDNPPLQFTKATATRFVTRAALPAPKGSVRLYAGNAAASEPSYDLAHYADRLRVEGVVRASLGPLADNPDFGAPADEAPWSERHRAILWVAMLGALAVLAFLIYRQVKTAPVEDE